MPRSRPPLSLEAVLVATVRGGMRALGALSRRLAARVADRLFTSPRRRAPRPDAGLDALRESGEPVEVVSGGVPLRGYAWGSGPAVLLVHGWEATWESLAAFVRPLREGGFRVVAVDAPGHGRSGGARMDLLAYARALAEVAAEVGPLHGVVAHSFGAPATVVALAGWVPGVPRGAVASERVVLVAPGAWLSAAMGRAAELMGLPASAHPAFARRVARRMGRPVDEFSVPAVAPELSAAALVVHDRGDREVPFAEGAAIAAAWGAELLATEGLGHNRVLRDPAVIRRAVDFLGGR